VPLDLIIEPILFLWNIIFTFYYTRVRPQRDFSILGRSGRRGAGVSSDWVMSHMNESCPIWMSCVPYEWVMSHINESCPIWLSHVPYDWVMSHMNESCPIWMSHIPYEWVMSLMNESYSIWMCHVPYEWVMSHIILFWLDIRTRYRYP